MEEKIILENPAMGWREIDIASDLLKEVARSAYYAGQSFELTGLCIGANTRTAEVWIEDGAGHTTRGCQEPSFACKNRDRFLQCLIDNGIEKGEANTVAEALYNIVGLDYEPAEEE